MDLSTEIASKFLVGRYQGVRSCLNLDIPLNPAWAEVLGAFRRRVEERFLRPIEQLMDAGRSEGAIPGFAILALDCLLIDTIQSFREGRVATGDMSPAKSFKTFLRSPRFQSFNSEDRDEFFGYVRNGLLHNGETRGDWKVRADLREMLSKGPAGSRTINRTRFHEAIAEEFDDYCRALEAGTPQVRELFLRRMDAICGLAPRPDAWYFAYGSNLLESEIRSSAPNARPDSVAFLPGHRLAFTKHSTTRGGDAASIQRHPSGVLWGYLYKVNEADREALKLREQGYLERAVRVWSVDETLDCEKGMHVDAFTFVGAKPCPDHCGPRDAYLTVLVDGAKLRGLPEDYIEEIGRARP